MKLKVLSYKVHFNFINYLTLQTLKPYNYYENYKSSYSCGWKWN